jgi:hypothetical protein
MGDLKATATRKNRRAAPPRPQAREVRVQENIREARLRPEYASLYPGVEPGVWLPATTIGQKLLLWHLATAATPQGERLMAEEHFEFRGGRGLESRNGARTRAGDQELQ